jgi:hypothetical protein
MFHPTPPSNRIVTPRIDALILSSPHLHRKILPEGLVTSPYEILDYRHTLVLHDAKGQKATFHPTQQIRFLQTGVSGILDHAWGDGVVITSYHNDAGQLEDSLRDAGQRHLVIGLKRTMRRGDRLTFRVARQAMEGFTEDNEWFESTIDRPVRRVRSTIVFPVERPCQQAALDQSGQKIELPIVRLGTGRTVVSFRTDRAQADTPYTILWTW